MNPPGGTGDARGANDEPTNPEHDGDDRRAGRLDGAGGLQQDRSADAKSATNDAVATVEQKAKEVGNDASNASSKMGDKIDDAMITTSVKAELAKDSSLSALKINVDTDNGKVALKGTAPSTAAREQATTLAQNVKGVVSVDNQLTVQQ